MTELSTEKSPHFAFASNLIRINHLDQLDFDRFVFFPGMLLHSTEKWWERSSPRKTSHEGLDLCFFINRRKHKYRLDETVKIPIIYKGRIVHIMDDFLGKTVVVRHTFETDTSGENSFFSFYAHIRPDGQIRVGDIVEDGNPLGTIADASTVSMPVLEHIHISMAWENMLPPVRHLTWDMLNRVERSAYIDPLPLLFKEYLILHDMPYNADIYSYAKCGLALNF